MKIQELRIGNYILDEEDFATVEIINGEMEDVTYMGPKTYLTDHISCIIPIVINAETLLKLGFKKTFDNEFNTSFSFNDLQYHIPKHGLNNGFAFFKRMSFKTKYVHQLQNLYFALTNNELVLNK
mgnify:CR=1 FL=1|tara:strand:+ start:104 stop:478 length:375 start_codon:yes stop_codon:yes gene_type:complete